MLPLLNDGFREGRVKKQDLASWILLHFHERDFQKLNPKIRAAHVDPILVLKAKIADLEAARKSNP
jgi:hypothetical protein